MQNKTVAIAVRIEHEPQSNKVYIVFEITDELFKQKIIKDLDTNIEVEMIGKELKEI